MGGYIFKYGSILICVGDFNLYDKVTSNEDCEKLKIQVLQIRDLSATKIRGHTCMQKHFGEQAQRFHEGY